MSWPRGSLFAALLVLSIPLASADTITVNTTTDDNADNSLCSLREAVEYFNLDKPKDGYQGCEAVSGSTDTVSLPADEEPYLIGSNVVGGIDHGAIVIRRSIIINGGGISDDVHSRIEVRGAHRAFVISDNPVVQSPSCTGPCSPTAAPQLAAAFDSLPLNDSLTTFSTPTFIVTLPAAPGVTDSVKITLYDTFQGAEPKAIGSVVANNAGGTTWSVAVTDSLDEGVHNISYTTTVNTNPESAQSVATRIGVHPSNPPTRSVTLSQLQIKGCVTSAVTDCANSVDGTVLSTSLGNGLTYSYTLAGTAGKGGVIYTEDGLALTTVIISDGAAAGGMGGAIFAGTNSIVSVMGSQLHDNTAAQGAAIYMSMNSIGISQSLFSGNTPAATAGAAVVNIANAAAVTGSTLLSEIEDSTFSGNAGLALSLRTGAVVNTSTIVLNGGGIDFNSQKVSVYNTILAANPDLFPAAATATDCQNLSSVPSNIDFVTSLGIEGGGCDTVASGIRLLKNDNIGVAVPAEKLMASESAGRCVAYVPATPALASFSGMGLLCPLLLGADEDDLMPVHLPRMLDTYTAQADSPVIAKGTINNATTAACTSTDQRNKPRRQTCDIGAAEMQPLTGNVRAGAAISYNQTYTEDVGSLLGDEHLFIPTASNPCPAYALTLPGDANKAGCPWISIPPIKGTVVFNADGSYTYTPGSNYHGFDQFSFHVVTSMSKLNQTADGRSRVIDAQINVEPTNGISTGEAAGTFDLWLLLALATSGLVVMRRSGKGATSC